MKNSAIEITEQIATPASIEMLPSSMLPTTPKNATKPKTERVAFSIATATVEVKKAMTAQIREMSLSPIFMSRGLLSVTTTVMFVL